MSLKELKEVDWDLEDADTGKYTAHIHPYPARFIPQIPQKFIDALTEEEDTVLDPFNGSGTTTLVGAVNGRESYGFDLNPLACMIAKAKTRDYNIDKLETHFEYFKNDIHSDLEKVKQNVKFDEWDAGEKTVNNVPIKVPDFPDKYDWFVPEVLNQIGYLNYRISKIDKENIKLFYKVNMSGILKNICRSQRDYTYIGDNMLPTKPTNDMVPDDTVHDVYSAFTSKVEENIPRLEDYLSTSPTAPSIHNEDSRNIGNIINDSINLAVTSPPYVNAVDYARYHRLSFYWFGFEVGDTREDEIGARSKRGRKSAIDDYFNEVGEVYKEVYNVLEDDGYFAIVVGDSQHKKERIQTSDRTLELCKDIGFSHVHTFTRNLSSQSMGQKKITEEDIILLQK